MNETEIPQGEKKTEYPVIFVMNGGQPCKKNVWGIFSSGERLPAVNNTIGNTCQIVFRLLGWYI